MKDSGGSSAVYESIVVDSDEAAVSKHPLATSASTFNSYSSSTCSVLEAVQKTKALGLVHPQKAVLAH